MSPRKVLIHKGSAIDRVTSLPARIRDISALNDKPILDLVHLGIEVMQSLIVSLAILSCAEPSEILGSFGSEVVEQLEDYPPCGCGSDLNVDIDLIVCL